MKRLVVRTVLPALSAIALFTGVAFFYFVPALSDAVMDQKRLMIRELTESAWNILARFEAEERGGRLSREEAQAQAIAQVRSLHYGQEGKDYFWINDMQPRMLVHPYRPDLEGEDISTFEDPHGKRLFVEMVRKVEAQGAGYVDYMWQWKDDESRIVPKLSYVKGFAPWGWILGTGVYIDDVEAEVARVTSGMQAAALLILVAVALLLFVLLRTSFQSERGRLEAMRALRASEAKYRSLVESAAESIFMAVESEGLFANASMLHLVGYSDTEFERLEIEQFLLPSAEEQAAARTHWQSVMRGDEAPTRYEAELICRDGTRVSVMLALSRIDVQGRVGFMAVATRIAEARELDLESARTASEIAKANRRMASMASLMVNHGAPAMQVSRLMNQNAELVVRRSLELAMQELGAPPAPFELLLMGSIGRSEPSLWADQDHAILYPDGLTDEDEARRYYLELGSKLSDLLDAAGYAYCPGGIMASEPECCRSLSGWKERFGSWIHALSPEDLLQVEIFFDFRAVHGSGTMAEELWRWLFQELRSEARFLPMLAHAVLQVEPPLTSLGGFVVDGDSETGTLNLKGVIAQYVGFARLRALQHGIEDTSTAGRLRRLAEAGQIRAETARETTEHFEFLMQLRMRHQAERLLAQLEPDNRIAPAQLEARERELLAAAFRHLKALQGVLAQEFTGGRS
jgi:CBS domain-containing protein